MKCVRIKTYYPDGQFTNCEHIYLGEDRVRALDKFLTQYPEQADCIIVSEPYETQDNKEHFDKCWDCGCVH